jgi:hypothetical protein
MDIAGVREALRREPFQPFDICLADGRRVPVRHPDFVAVGKRRIIVIQPDDSSMFIESLLIASLDYDSKRYDQMSRGKLDSATTALVSQQLPPIEELRRTASAFSPDIIAAQFGPDSTMPDAAVCLQDAVNTLAEARYALSEALAHKIWYLEKAEQKDEFAAVFFRRFYADDAALRLYSAGEHLANAVTTMLEIEEKELKPHKKGKTSRQAIVGCYLGTEKPNHPVTAAISILDKLPEWKNTRKYRGDWVHSQPALLKGTGIVYKRHKRRWQISLDGKHRELHFGGGDEPEYSIEDLLSYVQPALSKFAETCNTVVQFYVGLLQSHGITVSQDERGSRMGFKIL